MLNVITLFSGYDSQALALNRLGVDYDLAAWCEIDKHAIVAHNALFPQWAERNLGDVSKVDWQAFKAEHPEPIDLLTYSSPCQDFSSAGLQRGGEEGSGTRSGLLWEVEKAIAALKPRHIVFENVAALVSDKFIGVFNKWQARLNGYGYTNFQQLMNAKDYGVPQNRLRIFMVSILDCRRAYYFPKPFKLERRLKDVLEQNVEERYYLKEEQVAKLVSAMEKDASTVEMGADRKDAIAAKVMLNGNIRCYNAGNSRKSSINEMLYTNPENEAPTVTCEAQIKVMEPQWQDAVAVGHERTEEEKQRRHLYGDKGAKFSQGKRLCLLGDVSGCVTTVASKDNLCAEIYKQQPLLIPQATKEGYAVVPEGGVFDASYPDSTTRRGRVQEGGTVSPTIMASQNELLRYEGKIKTVGNLYDNNEQAGRIYDPEGIAPTLDNMASGGNKAPKIQIHNRQTIDGTEYGERHFYQKPRRTYRLRKHIGPPEMASTGLLPVKELIKIRIRRLTERELYRLMDVEEKDIDTLLAAPIPRTQHAKLAGNSIVVACLYYIFRNLFVDTEPAAGTQTKLF